MESGEKWVGFGVMVPTWARDGRSNSSSSPSSSEEADLEQEEQDLAALSVKLLEVLLNSEDLRHSTLLHDHLSPRTVTVGTFPDPKWATHTRCQLVHKILTQRAPDGGSLYHFDIHSSCVTAQVSDGARGRKGLSVVPASKEPLFRCGQEDLERNAAKEWILHMHWHWVGRKKWRLGCDKRGRWVCDRLETMTAAGGFGFW